LCKNAVRLFLYKTKRDEVIEVVKQNGMIMQISKTSKLNEINDNDVVIYIQ